MNTGIENIKNGVKKPKKLKIIIIISIITFVAALILFFALKPGDNSMQTFRMQGMGQFIPLAKTDIKDTLSLSGIVYSNDSKNVYSSLGYQVDKVFVEVGDKVNKGDVLIQLDTSSLLYEIETAENTLSNSKEALDSEIKNKQNGIINAENSLKSATLSRDKAQIQYEKSLDDLKEAEKDIKDPFDPYTYDNTVRDSKTALDRRAEDLKDAKADYNEAKNDFDDYSYQNNITEAKSSLDKRKDDLKKAEDKLKEAIEDFDDHTYQVAIKDAQVALERAKSQQATTNVASISEASDNRVTAERAVEDAERQIKNAQENLKKAKDKAKESAEEAVKDAKTALSDAQRAYDRSVTDLKRAKDDAVEKTEKELKTAQRNYDDAKKSYDKAISDRKRAQEDAIEDAEKNLKNARRSATDLKKALETSELNIITSKASLDQAKTKEMTAETTVKNQELSLKKLYDNLEKSTIKATVNGTITAVNAVEGNTASGILLTIENDGVFYVSANVMEFNIGNINIGQEVEITTVATKDKVFTGEVTYISPTAVNDAGSTSVEYEIWAEFSDPSDEVRIGMNAFVDVITAKISDVYAVSHSALVRDSSIYSNVDDIVTEIPVTVGIKTTSQVEISGAGLYDGLIVINNPAGFTPGESFSEAMERMGGGFTFGAGGPGGGPGGGMVVPGGGGGNVVVSGGNTQVRTRG